MSPLGRLFGKGRRGRGSRGWGKGSQGLRNADGLMNLKRDFATHDSFMGMNPMAAIGGRALVMVVQ